MLKALVLGKRISDLKKSLEDLRAKDADFEKREAELTEDFNSIREDSTDEEKAAVTEAMDAYDAEKEEHEKKKKDIEREIADTESELKDLEAKQEEQKPEEPAPEDDDEAHEEERSKKAKKAVRREMKMFKTRAIVRMSAEERDAFAKTDYVHEFAENIRSLAGIAQKRAVTGGELLIPTEILPLLQEEVYGDSRLLPLVYHVNVAGKARQNIIGKAPEGIWVEACAALQELALKFTDVETDGYKVGGYIPVCNTLLRDADVNLVDEVIRSMGEGIAYALDKAIVYGTGTKMPTGYAGTATKANVSGKTDIALYKAFVEATGSLKHGRGSTFWAMNRKTRMKMLAASMSVNAAGAIVAGTQGLMPVEGGTIVELDFVPDDEIVGGYGQCYLLAEREGTLISLSEHAQFIEDNTVFKGIAVYDGKPVFADAFMAIGLAGDPTGAIDANHPFAGVSASA